MWSAWPCVNRIASTRVTRWPSACWRRSGPASTRTLVRPVSTKMDGRSRVSWGSVERQVAHSQPIMGTPWDVPVPRNVILKSSVANRQSTMSGLDDDARVALLGLHEPHAQLVQQILDEFRLGLREIAGGLLLKHRDQLDDVRRGGDVRLYGAAWLGIGASSEMHLGRRRELQDEGGEINDRLFLVVHLGML